MHSVFTNRAFARLFTGRLITNAGDSVYTVAAMWLAFELGGSSFYTGLAGFLTMLPQTLQFLVGSLAATPLKRFSLAGLSIAGFAFGGVVWLITATVDWFPATVGLFFVAWIPVGATNVIFTAMIQSVVPEDLMGRVASVNASASVGAMPIGALLGGIAGDAVGSSVVVTSAGFGFIFLSLYWLAHPLLRGLSAVEDIEGERYGLVRPTRAESSESF